MSAARELQTAALLGHIASQMQLNVAFLESQHYLSPQDAATMKEIIGRLPVRTQASVATTTQVTVVGSPAPGGRAVPPAPRQIAAPPHESAAVYARTVWGYNEDGSVRAPANSRSQPQLTTSHDTGTNRLVLCCGRDDRNRLGEERGLVVRQGARKGGALPLQSRTEDGV